MFFMMHCYILFTFITQLTNFNQNAPHLISFLLGAIVGALYTAGYKPDDILDFFRKNASVFQWSKMTIRKPGLLDTDKYHDVLFEKLGYITFEQLDKQLFVTATDVIDGTGRIFEKGDVIKPVLASSALPPVFSPVEIEDKLYMDGGVMNKNGGPYESYPHHGQDFTFWNFIHIFNAS